MHAGLHVKYRLFLSGFIGTWIFSTDFRKILKSDFMKNRPVGAQFLADGPTAMTKLIVAFRNFTNAREKWEQVDIDIGGATVLAPRNTEVLFWQVIRISWLSWRCYGCIRETR